MGSQVKPAPLACLACRNKHLKCDGRLPVCKRCALAGDDCVFVRSRRGYRPRTGRLGEMNSFNDRQERRLVPSHSNGDATMSNNNGSGESSPAADAISVLNRERTETRPWQPNESLINIYYREFHPLHPILVSRPEFEQHRGFFPEHLTASICFVASHYANAGQPTYQQLPDSDALARAPDDIFKVQSYLLRAIASLARVERLDGEGCLKQAVAVARRLRLGEESVVLSQAPALQESCRRTWWELYVVSGLAKLMINVNVGLDVSDCELLLPQEMDPRKTVPPVSDQGTLFDMRDRFFSDVDRDWSSFAFKVEAARILGNIMTAENQSMTTYMERSSSDAFQAAISGWWLSLPSDKRDCVGDGSVKDETLFFAQMTMTMASISVHLPQSDLTYAWGMRTSCNVPSTASTQGARHHTILAVRAANDLSRLIATSDTSMLPTPCSACAVAFATIVQVSGYLSEQEAAAAAHMRENIQLGLNYLKRMSDIWPLAHTVRLQLAGLAREVLGAAPARKAALPALEAGPHYSVDDSLPWLNVAREALVGPSTVDVSGLMPSSSPPNEIYLQDEDSSWLEDLLNAPPVALGTLDIY